jgi:serine/threonine protein kinase
VGDELGDFRILGQLGEGGMGVVYLAEDSRLGRRLALKVIAPHLARDEAFRRRFTAEARSAAAIEHPNVVTVYSSGVVEENLYIAMRHVEGSDLRSVLSERGALVPAAAIAVVAEVAAALDAAHSAGLVHRDVKPANILLAGEPGDGTSYLTDFGLTKGGGETVAELTGTGRWMGTIDYVAPEQIQGETVDARTDVYALGCVLYETLSGNVPFAGNEMQKMWGHVHDPFPALAGGEELTALSATIQRATTKDPDERFPSAGDLARAAAAAAAGVEVTESERSVAAGPAAGAATAAEPGATKSAARPLPGQAPTVAGNSPLPPPRERATARMPSPSPPPPPRGSGSHGGRTAAIVAAAVILAAGLVIAAIVIAGGGDSPDTSTTTSAAVPQLRGGTGKLRGGDSAAPEPTLPPNLEPCSDTVSVGPVTSCPFALNVEQAYYASGEAAEIGAYSPVTGIEYTMECSGLAVVLCAGGKGASVYISVPGGGSEGSVGLGDWPGGSGYSAMIGAFSSQARARRWQLQAVRRGLDAGVLFSSEFNSLRPGYWVVFSGSFDSESEAAARAARAQQLGYSDSYPRFVSP